MDKFTKLVLGNHQESSLIAWLMLGYTVFTQMQEQGFDLKLTLIGVGFFFLLRFANERVPGLSQALAEGLRQLQTRQPTNTAPLNPPSPYVNVPTRQMDELQKRLIQLENENAGFRAELAVNQQRSQEVQRNATTQIDLARSGDPLRTEL